MSGHTPGPWAATKIDRNHFRIEQPNGGIVVNETTGGISLEVEEANARLISAAPELLAALIGLLEAVDATASSLLSTSQLEPGRVSIARAAIAKAEGREP